jgi:hypothetical protein
MAEQLNACKFVPSDRTAYAMGEELGRQWAGGGQVAASEALSQYVSQLSAGGQVSLFFGMSCTDPTDLRLVQNGKALEVRLDLKSELLVNETFGVLNQFSTRPASGVARDSSKTLDEAIQRSNARLTAATGEYSPQDSQVFVADFNRRRVENNWLPNVEAAIENGHAVIRKTGAN